MNYINVIGSTKMKRALVESAVIFCISELMPRMRTLEIEVNIKNLKSEGVAGWCYEGDNNRDFYIDVDKSLTGDFSLLNHNLNRDGINNYIYTGCQIINKKLFEKISVKNFSILEIWNDLIIKNKLFGYESKSKFNHLTNLDIYQKLLKKN